MQRENPPRPAGDTDRDAALAAAHRQLMAARVRRFAVCWLATTIAWSAVLVAEREIAPLAAAGVLASQAALLCVAIAVCARDPASARVQPTLVAVSALLGMSSTLLFAAARASGDALAFVLLTLYLACALFFAWGWRAQSLVWIATVVAWLAATPFLVLYLPAVELGTAIVIGSVLALGLAEGAARTFRLAWLHRAAEATIRRQLEASRDAAEAATRAKDEFLATVSHELRTPLNSILAWTQLLRFRTLPRSTAPHALEVIERNARRQARLIDDLLDVSRIVYGKLSIATKRIDLAQTVRTVVETVRGIADAKRVRLRVDVVDGDVPVRADPLRLYQVVENLVSNAVKFTPEGGEVTIVVCRDAGSGEVIVRDTGIGMAHHVLNSIFEPFQQVDRSTARRHGGLGLGLAIARHLVELHGGTIHAESAGEGRGSAFTVRLPLDTAADDGERADAGAATRERSLAGLRVVVVDDEDDARDVFTTLLAARGAAVTPAASAEEAMRRLSEQPADVLVADLAMPGEDGFALIRRVRRLEHARGTHVRAIAITALAGVDDRRRAMAAGFDVHLAKPVDAEAVVAAVAGEEPRPAPH
jgi:signal transduction histidine kinase/CheY-like chemotaxis protein